MVRSHLLQRIKPILSQYRPMSDKIPRRPEHLDLTVEHFRHPEMVAAVVEDVKQLSPTVKGFRLRLDQEEGKENPQFKAGQWVDFFIPGMDQVGGFSMCSSPDLLKKEGVMDLAIKYSTWPPANWLHSYCEIGHKVAMRIGGNFHYPNNSTRLPEHDVLLIAGGVGVNPLASIFLYVRDRLKEKDGIAPRHTHILFSAKDESELLFKKKMNQAVNENPSRLSATYHVTQGPANSKAIKRGRISQADILGNITDPKVTYCFLCGPTSMIKTLDQTLKASGVPKENIFYELWW